MNTNSVNRNLDGIYFRVEREGKFHSICLSDMTEDELDDALSSFGENALRRTCAILARTIREMGDQLDLYGKEDDE